MFDIGLQVMEGLGELLTEEWRTGAAAGECWRSEYILESAILGLESATVGEGGLLFFQGIQNKNDVKVFLNTFFFILKRNTKY